MNTTTNDIYMHDWAHMYFGVFALQNRISLHQHLPVSKLYTVSYICPPRPDQLVDVLFSFYIVVLNIEVLQYSTLMSRQQFPSETVGLY